MRALADDDTLAETDHTLEADVSAAPSSDQAPIPPERYRDLGPLGAGGMGEVRKVEDVVLRRALAMKLLTGEGERRRARFVAEAQMTAQLQHPGIVPVHELGLTPDGIPYFTMREVRGQTLAEVVHASHDPQDPMGWPLRRMIDVFRRICDAVAYAHQRGVVHRDLKPENVMLGAHGEVLVLDWGIAKTLEELEPRPEPVVTDRSTDSGLQTAAGAITGTPAFMAPEQASGAPVDVRADVYALGVVLYEMIAGELPFDGAPFEVLNAKLTTEPATPSRRVLRADEVCSARGDLTLPVPPALVPICERAMARDRDARYADAGELGAEIGAWLEGSRRRDEGLALVRRAEEASGRAAARRRDAEGLRAGAEELAATLRSWEPESTKHEAWRLEDAADGMLHEAARAELDARRLLDLAIETEPGLVEAHAALGTRYRDDHRAAERARDDDAAARAEARLRRHVDALPPDHPVAVELSRYLAGDGTLSLRTSPPGAEIALHRYERVNRRLVPRPVRDLGPTPLEAVALPMGSYLCVLRVPGRPEVRYPVAIGREQAWSPSAPVTIPERSEADECFVPAGPFVVGGDPVVPDAIAPQIERCDDFVIQRLSTTNRQYIEFLDDLVATGREDEALRWQPRERGSMGQPGEAVFRRDVHGRFVLVPDADGDLWEPDWPVLMIDWFCARAYAEWYAARTGLPWRLPTTLEWEKAARGVDARFYPWGDHYDGSWACSMESHPGHPQPASVGTFEVDESVYGVRGMAGNARTWTATRSDGLDAPVEPDTRVEARGGFWCGSARAARCAHRYGMFARTRDTFHGLRLARSL